MKRALSLFVCAVSIGCNNGATSVDAGARDAAAPDAGLCPPAVDGGPTMSIAIFTAQHLDGIQGSPTFQSATATATIPPGCWSNAILRLHQVTHCTGHPPAGQNWPPLCDPYDRLAQVTLADPRTTQLLLLDAVTPFGGESTWDQDVTDYLPALTGAHSFNVDIGVWADGAGMATGTMASHDIDVTLILTPGAPPHDVLSVQPLFHGGITPSNKSITAMFEAPKGSLHGRIDFFTSGHGGNGNPPCDEFCQKENVLSVDSTALYDDNPWVDCSDNCDQAPGKASCLGMTFDYTCKQNPTACPASAVAPRSNWCPSKIIAPFALDLPTSALTGQHTVDFTVLDVSGDFEVGLAAVFYK